MREVILENSNDPAIAIDPNSIVFAFVGLTHSDYHYSEKLKSHIADFNRRNQPRLWNTQINAKFVTFTADRNENGYPDEVSSIIALEKLGLVPHSSIVINFMLLSLDGGLTETKIQNGFAFIDDNPRIFVGPRKDFIIPK
jgi:hypothetical protein